MRISEQARKAAKECSEVERCDPNIIQTAINAHERDLVEAAQRFVLGLKSDGQALIEFKAALERRKE